MLPNDKELMKGYRQLLLERSEAFKKSMERLAPQEENAPTFEPETVNSLPEASRDLVAPVPLEKKEDGLTRYEAVVQNYGVALSYYYDRKLNGASKDELKHLLQQMKAVYGRYSIDLGIVDREIISIESGINQPLSPFVEKKATPVKAEPKVSPTTPVNKPKKASAQPAGKGNAEFERSWSYFEKAVEEGISDREKIQLLESIVNQFGSLEAGKAEHELKRLKNGGKY